MTFRVHKSSDKRFPHFSQPKTIGYFSLDGTRTICFDSSKLSYYSHRKPNKRIKFDLNQGIDIVKRKPESVHKEHINHMLKWIISNVHQVLAYPDSGRWLYPNFICYRGLLTKIIKSPYDAKEGWIICAVKWRGSIYLCSFDTEEDKLERANRTEKQRTCMSWGFKFEQYMLSDTPHQPPDTSKPVDESEEFCCMFQSRLADNCLLYAAEMDGLLSDEVLKDPLPLEKLKFVELKTNRIIDNPHQMSNLKKFKFLRWWCQSFLVGIEHIICGFRDDRGIVRELKDYRVADMARMSKEFWTASIAMNFCDAFLNYVSKTVVNEYDQSIYKFEKIPFGDIVLTEVSPSSEYAFLPEWYTKSKS